MAEFIMTAYGHLVPKFIDLSNECHQCLRTGDYKRIDVISDVQVSLLSQMNADELRLVSDYL